MQAVRATVVPIARKVDKMRAAATRRREVADIAYGFIGSKALFAALELGLFTALADGPRPAMDLAAALTVAPPGMTTLLRVLAALGLVIEGERGYANAPAAQRHLVRGAEGDIGEYYRLQIGRQIYPALGRLDAGIAGKGPAFDGFGELMAQPDEAATFTVTQHTGSLAVARTLAGRISLPGARSLLDVGGGSGAFSIAFCAANPTCGPP